MPMIGGVKYSCEPCIRGHRSTSCEHTDRHLVEVRKPGRPMSSCPHEIGKCFCGKLTNIANENNMIAANNRSRTSSPLPQQPHPTYTQYPYTSVPTSMPTSMPPQQTQPLPLPQNWQQHPTAFMPGQQILPPPPQLPSVQTPNAPPVGWDNPMSPISRIENISAIRQPPPPSHPTQGPTEMPESRNGNLNGHAHENLVHSQYVYVGQGGGLWRSPYFYEPTNNMAANSMPAVTRQ